MITFTKANTLQNIEYRSQTTESDLNLINYYDIPKFISMDIGPKAEACNKFKIMLVHPTYELILTFTDYDTCIDMHDKITEEIQSKTAAPDLDQFGDLGGMGEMFGSMFGNVPEQSEQPDINPETESPKTNNE